MLSLHYFTSTYKILLTKYITYSVPYLKFDLLSINCYHSSSKFNTYNKNINNALQHM